MAWSWSMFFIVLTSRQMIISFLGLTHLLESFLKYTKDMTNLENIELTKVIKGHQGGSGWLFQPTSPLVTPYQNCNFWWWGGDDDVPCMCTHARCYATDALLLHTCSMLRN